MPIYEYQCPACGKELEVLQKVSDEPLRDCPQCGKSTLQKKVSAAAFRLKGGGWYETDFKTGNKKNLATGSETSGTASSSSTAAASSDSGTAKSST